MALTPTVLSFPRAGVMCGIMRVPAINTANSPLIMMVLPNDALGLIPVFVNFARELPAERLLKREVPATTCGIHTLLAGVFRANAR